MKEARRLSNRAIIGIGLLICIVVAVIAAQFLGLLDLTGVL